MAEEHEKPPFLDLFDDRINAVPRLVPPCETAITRLQDAIHQNPYNGSTRLKLAQEYSFNGYPDLAAGEANMVLLLYDEVENPDSEFHDPAILEAARDMGDGAGIDEEAFAASLEEDEKQQEVTSWMMENVCRSSYACHALGMAQG
jgi:hypothetical protein